MKKLKVDISLRDLSGLCSRLTPSQVLILLVAHTLASNQAGCTTQAEIAQVVGLTSERVCTLMRLLSSRGYVVYERTGRYGIQILRVKFK